MKRTAFKNRAPLRSPAEPVHPIRRKLRLLDLSDILLSVSVAFLVLGITLRSLTNWWNGYFVGGAHVTEVHGKVSHRAEDSLSWYELTRGDHVNWEEHLKTERNGAVRLRLENGTDLDLQSDSQAHLSRNDVDMIGGKFRVQSGWETVKAHLGDDGLELKVGTEAYLLKDPASGREQIVVTKGEVLLKSDRQKTRIVREGETYRIKPDELLLRVDPALTFEPSSPKNGETIIASDTSTAINLKWNGTGERVEMDKTPGFLAPKIYAFSPTGINLVTTVGKYYWRLGDKNRVSQTSDFLILPKITYQPITPQTLSYVVSQGEITFKWAAIPNATRYLIQLSRWPDFRDPLVSQTFTTTAATLNPIPPGAYYWRIQATYKDLGDWPFSDGYPFAVGKKELREIPTRPRAELPTTLKGPTQ